VASRTMKMRHLCIAVIAAWLVSIIAAFSTRNIQHFGIIHAGCFIVAATTAPRIAFTEVPVNRALLSLWLPLALALFAITGDFVGLGRTVSWALIALSLIAGARAANLLQIVKQRT